MRPDAGSFFVAPREGPHALAKADEGPAKEKEIGLRIKEWVPRDSREELLLNQHLAATPHDANRLIVQRAIFPSERL
jgi:hypothetical protein